MISRQAKWQQKQLALGLCRLCPQPLAPGSRSFCETHVIRVRERARERAGTILPHADRRAVWDAVDWSKSSSEIAEDTGYAINYVSTMRRKLAPETLRGGGNRRGRPPKDDKTPAKPTAKTPPPRPTAPPKPTTRKPAAATPARKPAAGAPAKAAIPSKPAEKAPPKGDYLHFQLRQKRRSPRKHRS